MKLEFDSVEELLEFVNKIKTVKNTVKAVKQNKFVTIDCGCYRLMVSGGRGDSYKTGNKRVNFYQAQQWIDEQCNVTKLGGYDDWVVPTKDELNLLYENKNLFKGNDAFYDFYYWSSSETSATDAWRQNFYNGNQYNRFKTLNSYVRAVRRISLN